MPPPPNYKVATVSDNKGQCATTTPVSGVQCKNENDVIKTSGGM